MHNYKIGDYVVRRPETTVKELEDYSVSEKTIQKLMNDEPLEVLETNRHSVRLANWASWVKPDWVMSYNNILSKAVDI